MKRLRDSLSRKKFQNAEISSKLALFLVIFSVVCGLITFILCLVAESTKSEVTWLLLATPNSEENRCIYSGSGRTPLACAVASLLLLAVAMFCEHAYMLIAVTNPKQPAMAAWATVPQDRRATTTHRDLSWQACCLFLTTCNDIGRQNDTSNIFVGGFILGGLIMAALGYVYAPKISNALAGADKKDLMKKLPWYDEEKALESIQGTLYPQLGLPLLYRSTLCTLDNMDIWISTDTTLC